MNERIIKEAAQLKQLSKILRVIANPIRLKILYCLREKGKLSVGELVETLNCKQAVVSSYLSKLVDSGIVAKKQEGRFHFYYVENERVYDVLDCLTKCMRT